MVDSLSRVDSDRESGNTVVNLDPYGKDFFNLLLHSVDSEYSWLIRILSSIENPVFADRGCLTNRACDSGPGRGDRRQRDLGPNRSQVAAVDFSDGLCFAENRNKPLRVWFGDCGLQS